MYCITTADSRRTVLNEVITVTMKPSGVIEECFRRDSSWIQQELNVDSIRVFNGCYVLFELRFRDLSDLMAGLDWLNDYFSRIYSVIELNEVRANVRWTRKRDTRPRRIVL